MRGLLSYGARLLALVTAVSALPNSTLPNQIPLGTFSPPAVFENTNLVRTINLERSYPRDSVNVVIKNVGKEPQDQYYMPFDKDMIGKIGGFEVKDKQKADIGPFLVDVVQGDSLSATQYYRITLPTALAADESQTLAINYHTVGALEPLPASIAQNEKQYFYFPFSAYFPSTYPTLKQKTKVRFPNTEVLAYTKLGAEKSHGVTSENTEDPVKEGKTYTYGPFGAVPGGVLEPAGVHYENTKPLMHATLLERDVEVSHWGGNLATEERFWLENRGAALKGYFNRVMWQQNAYFNPASVALKEFKVPLAPGSRDAYFIDDIGNVSTSKFNPGDGVRQPAILDLKPRYPVFGDWKYSFKIGWDRDLSSVLRKLQSGSTYVLRVPFLEGPREREGIEYEKVVTRVILPEGASNIQFSTSIPLVSSTISLHRTFMDTQGRTSVTLEAVNLSDEARNKDLMVTYDLPFIASLRKPLTILTAVFGLFTVTWLLSRIDVEIKPRKG